MPPKKSKFAPDRSKASASIGRGIFILNVFVGQLGIYVAGSGLAGDIEKIVISGRKKRYKIS